MLQQIHDRSDPALPFVQELYESAFPLHERRAWPQVLDLLTHRPMELLVIREGALPVGFAIRWQIGVAQYLEHFAVDPALRGQQYGSRVMRQLLAAARQQLILEVEPPGDALSRRRIQFYERHGLVLAPYDYLQPPYRKGEPPLPMRLMSLPAIPGPEAMKAISQAIGQTVYQPFWT